MPFMILLPDDTDGSSSSDWITAGIGTSSPDTALVDDNGDTSYVKCNDDNEFMIIDFANPSVAEADIESITSVQFLSSGRSSDRRSEALVDIAFQVPSGFEESCYYDAHDSSNETINGTAREVKPFGGAVWEYSDLENLEMKCTKDGTEEVYLGYLALKVIYEQAVSADNATFFGANF